MCSKPFFPLYGQYAGSRESGWITKNSHKMHSLLPLLSMSGFCHMVIINSYLFLENTILRGVVKMYRREKYRQMRFWLLITDSTIWSYTRLLVLQLNA